LGIDINKRVTPPKKLDVIRSTGGTQHETQVSENEMEIERRGSKRGRRRKVLIARLVNITRTAKREVVDID